MELRDAVWALEAGYCLWVGAGVTRQLAAGDPAAVPLWGDLTRKLESAAGLPRDAEGDFPRRLDACLSVLGEREFRSILRRRYYTQLCATVMSQTARLLETDRYFPEHVRPIAALGQLANPIISFNIEPLSSALLARSAGPARILFQQPAGKPMYTWREPGGRFQRLVYHPHGLATIETVMTANQYQANSQTLAFGVAIHAAFGNALAIVGMSLDDDYLRTHIESFRASVGPIYWFNSHFPDRLALWARAHDVTMVRAEWREFWECWGGLPIDLDERELAAAWYLVVSQAVEEAEGGALSGLQRSIVGTAAAENVGFRELAAYSARVGANLGETGEPILIDGKEPRPIELAFRERLMKAELPLPLISKSYRDVVSPA
jgi:hypothetical protein